MSLERRKPLKRTTKPLKRTRLARTSKTNSRPPKAPVIIHGDTRARARARSLGICIMCTWKIGLDVQRAPERRLRELLAQGVIRGSWVLHHVFPRQTWPALIEVEDNLVCVCDPCHDEHERWRWRIPRAALPQVSIDLAEHDEAMLRYIEETYPATA